MVSALIMSQNLRQLQSLQQAIDPQILLEGGIWSPRQNIEQTAEWTTPA